MVFGLKLGLPKKTSVELAEPPRQEPTAACKGTALTVNEFVARTKKCREKGLEPTKPELIAYARYLGIDPITDGDLMWIADEALNPPLPAEWTEHHDSADRVFYYNVQTQGSCWVHPLEQLHRDTYKTIVDFRSNPRPKEEQKAELAKLQQKCENTEREVHLELQAWSEHTDDQGQKFYYNAKQQRSVWTDPRPARCHCLYLQMKALKVMGQHCGQEITKTVRTHWDFGEASVPAEPFDTKGPAPGSNLKSPLSKGVGVRTEGALVAEEPCRDREERKRRKKRRDREAAKGRQEPEHLLEESLLESSFGEVRKKSPLKKSIAKVEEVRAALGVSEQPSGGLCSPTKSCLSPSGGLLSLGRLEIPQGDGLSTVGRTKVRAGIRLEPLQGGA